MLWPSKIGLPPRLFTTRYFVPQVQGSAGGQVASTLSGFLFLGCDAHYRLRLTLTALSPEYRDGCSGSSSSVSTHTAITSLDLAPKPCSGDPEGSWKHRFDGVKASRMTSACWRRRRSVSDGNNSTGSRLMVAAAAPVTMFVAPGPMDDVQAIVARRRLALANPAAVWTIACSLQGRWYGRSAPYS